MLLLNATMPDGSRADVELAGERVHRIAPAGSHGELSSRKLADAEVGTVRHGDTLDLTGHVLVPAFVNGHAHLDKTFIGSEWQPHEAGDTVRSRIDQERARLSSLRTSVRDRASALAALMVQSGTGTVRTHVDIDPIVGLSGFDALCELREAVAGRLRIQIVAFPQRGVLAEGTAELLDEALRRGADAIGAVDPVDIDGDAVRSLDTVFALAGRHGVGVDIHLHAGDPAAAVEYELIVDRTQRHDLHGRVAIAHAPGLGSLPCEALARVSAQFAAAGISVMTAGPAGAMPPVEYLQGAGVEVFAGTDNVRDWWQPFGDGDMLGIARQIAFASGFRTDAQLATALHMITSAAASALGIRGNRIRPGDPADLVALEAESATAAVACPPASRLTFHRGQPVAHRRLTTALQPERAAVTRGVTAGRTPTER